MIKHRFNVPRHAIESTRREANSARFRESLRLREAAGYLQQDRHATVEAPPALLLTTLAVDSNGAAVDSNGAAVATLETLATDEGRIVAALVAGLDVDEYRFTLVSGKYGELLGVDFELTDLVTRPAVRRVLARSFDDAADIAAALVEQRHEPIETVKHRAKPEMIGDVVVQRAAELERQQITEKARRNVKALGYTFD
ncbi:hypothetical protein [Halomonas hibernica]|uniref:hypothetical protein n=1 Tax=Halomonas hibernica TaxID=2591147 RepID=UPI0015570145|nr:hypothetical protein [Halomonas hibernica]